MGPWEALGAKVGCFGGRGARRGGKAKSINVCEVFDKTWVKYKHLVAWNWRTCSYDNWSQSLGNFFVDFLAKLDICCLCFRRHCHRHHCLCCLVFVILFLLSCLCCLVFIVIVVVVFFFVVVVFIIVVFVVTVFVVTVVVFVVVVVIVFVVVVSVVEEGSRSICAKVKMLGYSGKDTNTLLWPGLDLHGRKEEEVGLSDHC